LKRLLSQSLQVAETLRMAVRPEDDVIGRTERSYVAQPCAGRRVAM